MSYTVLPYTAPYSLATQDVINAAALFLTSNNVYTTTQSFFNVVNTGTESITGTLNVTGVATLGQVNAQALSCSSLSISGAGSDAAAFTTASLNVSAATVLGGALTVSGPSSLQALTCTTLACASEVDAGLLTAQTLNVSGSSVLTGPVQIAGAITASSSLNVQGAASLNSLTVANQMVCSAGLQVANGPIVLPTTTANCNCVAGVLSINLQSQSFINFSYVLTANVTSIVITNALVNGIYHLYLNGGASGYTVSRSQGAGIVNNLASNTYFSAGSRWVVKIIVPASGSYILDYSNYV